MEVKMKVCSICQKTEQEQGTNFDCEVWKPNQKYLILICDDCFFNERDKLSKTNNGG